MTRIGAAALQSFQSGITRVYAGEASLVRLTIDGRGNQSGRAASGSILVLSGQVIAPTISASGQIVAASTIIGANASISGGVTCYGTVLGNQLMADGGGTGLTFKSGTGISAYHRTDHARISGNGSVTAFSVSVTSGTAMTAVVRTVGYSASGSIHQQFNFGYAANGYTGSTPGGVYSGFFSDVYPSGSLVGGIAAITSNNYTVAFTLVGSSGKVVDYTTYADITIAP